MVMSEGAIVHEAPAATADLQEIGRHMRSHNPGERTFVGNRQCCIAKRMRLIDNGMNLEIEYTATDPKSWEGEWKWTKRWRRVDDTDITEASCLPDLNEHMLSTKGNANVR